MSIFFQTMKLYMLFSHVLSAFLWLELTFILIHLNVSPSWNTNSLQTFRQRQEFLMPFTLFKWFHLNLAYQLFTFRLLETNCRTHQVKSGPCLGLLEIKNAFKAGFYPYHSHSHSGMSCLLHEIPPALALIFYSNHKWYGLLAKEFLSR